VSSLHWGWLFAVAEVLASQIFAPVGLLGLLPLPMDLGASRRLGVTSSLSSSWRSWCCD